jgi:hypothetical protein
VGKIECAFRDEQRRGGGGRRKPPQFALMPMPVSSPVTPAELLTYDQTDPFWAHKHKFCDSQRANTFSILTPKIGWNSFDSNENYLKAKQMAYKIPIFLALLAIYFVPFADAGKNKCAAELIVGSANGQIKRFDLNQIGMALEMCLCGKMPYFAYSMNGQPLRIANLALRFEI